jgi:hypothetical protein
MINLIPHTRNGADKEWISRQRREPQLPVALHANSESRHLALKHYRILFQTTTPYRKHFGCEGTKPGNTGARPICIDPNLDLVYIDFKECLTQETRVAELYHQDPDCFNSIRTLEVRNVCWPKPRTRLYTRAYFLIARAGALQYFHGLQTLHLVEGRDEMFQDNEDAVDLHSYIWGRLGTFQRRDPPDVKRSIPKVVFHHWRRLQTRSDDEHLNFAKMEFQVEKKYRVRQEGSQGPREITFGW